MLATRNVITFFGLCGLAMALSGQVWPGAFVMGGVAIAIALHDDNKGMKVAPDEEEQHGPNARRLTEAEALEFAARARDEMKRASGSDENRSQ